MVFIDLASTLISVLVNRCWLSALNLLYSFVMLLLGSCKSYFAFTSWLSVRFCRRGAGRGAPEGTPSPLALYFFQNHPAAFLPIGSDSFFHFILNFHNQLHHLPSEMSMPADCHPFFKRCEPHLCGDPPPNPITSTSWAGNTFSSEICVPTPRVPFLQAFIF